MRATSSIPDRATVSATTAFLLALAACSSSSSSPPFPSDAAADSSSDVTPPDAKPDRAKPHDAGGEPSESGSGARANGTLGPWQTLTPMPVPRANHCAVVVNGYLVVLGGNYAADGGFVTLDRVDVAPLHADGSIGSWSQAGKTPSPVDSCTVAASGDTIYLVDGIYDDMADEGHAFAATLSPSGMLGAWKASGALPNGQDAFYSNAWIGPDSKATLYAVDSNLTRTLILEAPTSPSFGAWSGQPWLAGFLGRPAYAFTGEFFYAIGGYLSTDGGNPAVSTVDGSPLETAGKVGASFATQALPAPLTFAEAVAVDGWIFVVGGKSSVFGSGEAQTLSSQVGAGGKLGPWKAQTALPQGRTDMALTLGGDFLYQTGGGYTGPGLDTVFAARVRF